VQIFFSIILQRDKINESNPTLQETQWGKSVTSFNVRG